MKAVTSSILVIIAVIMIAGCQGSSFEKTKSNLVYKIYRSKDTAAVRTGEVMKVQVIQKINDSVLFDSHESTPVYIPVGQTRPYDPSEVFTKLKLNDSLVTVQMMDTFIKQNPRFAQRFKNGDRVILTFKVLHIYKQGENYMADQQKDQDAVIAAKDKELDDYIAKNKINATKTADGVYVEIKNQGQGAQADTGKFVSVMYKGTRLNGKVFDSNNDSTSLHKEPLQFTIGKREMIQGFDLGVRQFKNGGEGRIFIPAKLGFGPNPNSPDIKPFDPVIFEVKIVDVADKGPEPQQLIPGPQTKVDTTQRKK